MRLGRTALVVLLLALLAGLRADADSLACAAVAFAGASLAFALASARPGEAEGVRWVMAAFGALALLVVGALEPLRPTAGLFHREIRGFADLAALTPLAGRELAGPLAAAALPLCAGLVRTSARPALAWTLAALLAALLAAFGGPSAWVACALGLGWTAWRGGSRARRRAAAGAVALAVAAIGLWAFVGVGWLSGNARVRAYALAGERALQAWAQPAGYVLRADLDALAPSPWTGHGLGRFTDAYQACRPDSPLAVAGVERPPTARNDLVQAAIECGAPAALVALAAFVALSCRASGRDRYLGGALVATGVAALAGHAFAPANQLWVWALLGLAARGDRPSEAGHAHTGQWPPLVLLAGTAACLGCAALLGPAGPLPLTRGEALALEASRSSGPARLAGLARAAEAFATRWEVVEAGPPGLGRAWERARYERFLCGYALELAGAQRGAAARAYAALRDGLAAQGEARPEPSLTMTNTVLSR